MPVIVGDVELYTGPRETGAPDDLKRAIAQFVDGARRRLDVAVQEVDIALAGIAAGSRGVTVRVVYSSTYARRRGHEPDRPSRVVCQNHDAPLG